MGLNPVSALMQGLSPRRQKFVHEVAKGLAVYEAYRKAGFSTKGGSAQRESAKLAAHPAVAGALAEARAALAERTTVTVTKLTGMLLDAHDMARDLKRPGDMVAATMGVAKLHGFLVDRAQLDVLVHKPSTVPTDVLDLSVEDWARANAVLLGAPGLGAPNYTGGSTMNTGSLDLETQNVSEINDLGGGAGHPVEPGSGGGHEPLAPPSSGKIDFET